MGRRNLKGSVSIDKDKNRIRLRWRYQDKRYSLNLFHFTKTNLLQAKKIALNIESDLLADSFDVSLVKYRPQIQHHPTQSSLLFEHFELWVRYYRNMDCDKHIDYWAARNMLKRWGTIPIKKVVQKLNGPALLKTWY